jgi:hypothetical protein
MPNNSEKAMPINPEGNCEGQRDTSNSITEGSPVQSRSARKKNPRNKKRHFGEFSPFWITTALQSCFDRSRDARRRWKLSDGNFGGLGLQPLLKTLL